MHRRIGFLSALAVVAIVIGVVGGCGGGGGDDDGEVNGVVITDGSGQFAFEDLGLSATSGSGVHLTGFARNDTPAVINLRAVSANCSAADSYIGWFNDALDPTNVRPGEGASFDIVIDTAGKQLSKCELQTTSSAPQP